MNSLDSFLEFEKRREQLQSPLLEEAGKALEDTEIEIPDDNGAAKQAEIDQKKDDAMLLDILEEAKTINPDKAVKVRKLSETTGLMEELVEEDVDGIERSVEIDKNKEILDKSPKLKEMTLETNLSMFANDDFENLGYFEGLHRDASVGLERGMKTRELGLARRRLMGEIFEDELTEPEKQELRNRIKEIQDQLRQLDGGSGGFVEAAAKAIGTFIEGVPQVIAAGALSGGAAATGAALTGPAAPAVVATAASVGAAVELYRQSSQVEGGLIAQDLVDAGVEKNIANNVGEVAGDFAGLLEVTGAKIIASPFKDLIKKRFLSGVKRKILQETAKKSKIAAGVKTFGKTIAGETATEVGQELIAITGVETGKALSDKEFESITGAEIQHQVGEVFKETLKAMTILAIPGATISMYNQKRDADQATANQEYLNSLSENVQGSKLKQRDGETHKEFVKRVHEGTSIDNVYIDAKQLQEVYQDDVDLLVEEIGATEQFKDALEGEGDIVIPLSVYTDKIAGDVVANSKISPHVKFDPNGTTAFLAEEEKKAFEELAEKGERILREQAQNTEFIASSEKVFDGVRKQLIETGRFNDETADTYASLHKAMFASLAKKLGKTPEEVYKKFPLRIRGESQISDEVQTLEQAAEAVKRTPEFEAFFKDSKITDEKGEPRVVYHGTTANIESFDKSTQGKITGKQGGKELGFFFASTPDLASRFSEFAAVEEKTSGQNVLPVFLDIKNPFILDFDNPISVAMADVKDNTLSNKNIANVVEVAKRLGHDGIIVKGAREAFLRKPEPGETQAMTDYFIEDQFITFEPNQSKSIFNVSPTDSPNILEQAARRDGLYSALEQALEDMNLPAWKKDPDTYPKVGQANGKDIWAKLKTMPGIKKEELNFSGIEEFLTGNPKAKFSRERVVAFARNNGIKLEVVVAEDENLEGDAEIAWTSERIWDDPEAWKYLVDDADYNGIMDKVVWDLAKEEDRNIPENIERDKDQAQIWEYMVENYESEIEEGVEARARELYMQDPVYIVETMDDTIGLSLMGNDAQGWDIRRGGWQNPANIVEGDLIYSLSEAKIQAMDYAVEQDLISPTGDETIKKWEDYTMDGDKENYREVKLTLPDIEEDFYEEAHFPDRNIVAFLRVDDREMLSGEGTDDISPQMKSIYTIPPSSSMGKGKILKPPPDDAVAIKADKGDKSSLPYPPGFEIKEETFGDLRRRYEKPFIVYEDGKDYSDDYEGQLEATAKGIGVSADNSMKAKMEYGRKIARAEYGYHLRNVPQGKVVGKSGKIGMLLPAGQNFRSYLQVPASGVVPVEPKDVTYFHLDKTYFIEEFQSDWHQDGRQKGYRTGKTREEIEEAKAQELLASTEITTRLQRAFETEQIYDEKRFKGQIIFDVGLEKYGLDFGDFSEIASFQIKEDFPERWMDRYTKLTNSGRFVGSSAVYKRKWDITEKIIKDQFSEEEIEQLQNYIAEEETLKRQIAAEEKGVPDVPFKGDSWLSLGLKRAIVDAVDGGYGSIAWSNSETLVDRWSDRYRTLYQNQYDKKMPSIMKKLTKQVATHMHIDGYPMKEEGGFEDEGYHIIPITQELRERVQKEGFTLFQDRVDQANAKPDWYYSKLAESFDALPDSKAQPKTSKGWKQVIKKLGVKQQELEWTGIFEWLDTKTQEAQILDLEDAIERRVKKRDAYIKGDDSYNLVDADISRLQDQLAQVKAGKGYKITKSEISNFLFNNGISIETVEIGSMIGANDDFVELNNQDYENELHDRAEQYFDDLLKREVEAGLDMLVQDEIFRLAKKDADGNSITGEPVEVTRKRIEDKHREEIEKKVYDSNDPMNEILSNRAWENARAELEDLQTPESFSEIGTDLTDYTFPGGEDESSILLKFPPRAAPKLELETNVVQKLWNHAIHIYGTRDYQPGYNDLLRFPTWQSYVQDKNLKFLPGHKDAKDVFTKEEERYFDKNRLRIQQIYKNGPRPTRAFESHVFPGHANIITWIRKQTREVDGKKILFIDEIQSDLESAVRGKTTPVQVPFTDSQSAYVGLAMKKIITYAVENDFDRVEWTSGSQQSERYKSSLVSTVARIKYNPAIKQLSVVRAEHFVGTNRLGDHWTDVGKVEQKNLPAMVGKDVARTLLEEPIKDGTHSIDTGNVEISDKGMVDFYDRLVPDVAAKMVKSITGEKITMEYEDPAPDSYDAGRQPGFDVAPLKRAFNKTRPSLAVFQKKQREARGSFQFAEDITKTESAINLFKSADLSTFLHESGHFFFEVTRHLANQADSPQEIKDDMNTLLKFVGVEDINKWNSMSLEARREGHERVARAFEAYLFEGRAPSADLTNMFRRFKSWLVALYKNLTSLQVDLSDDVRGVFDRMLASDEEIRLTRESEGFKPLWESRESAGMTQEEWVDYKAKIVDEEEEADEMLQARALRDMKYMEGARGRVLRNIQRTQRERRAELKKEATLEVANRRVYKAKQFLRTPVQKRPKVKINPNVVDPTRDSLFTAIAKLGGLNKDEVVATWGIDPQTKLSSGVGAARPVWKKDDPSKPKEKRPKSIDDMGVLLSQEGYGYLPLDENDKYDPTDLEDRFLDELNGNKRVSIKNDEWDVAEAYENFLAEEEGLVHIDNESGGKLSLQALIEEYGNGEDALWKQLPLKGRYAMVTDQDHGGNPDHIARGLGYSSGDQMIQELVAAPDMRVVVEEETDAKMLEVFGDMNSQEAKTRAITEALHGEQRARVLHTEMKVLAKKVGARNVLAASARKYAKDKIAGTRIMDIRPNDYMAAERRANRNAERAIGKGDLNLAADHKRAAILNFYFAREATQALSEVDRVLRYFDRLDGKSARKRIGFDASAQIDRMLNRYDLRKSATNKEIEQQQILSKWIAAEEAKGNTPVIPANLQDETKRVHYRTIAMEELRGLNDAIQNIDHLGSNETRLILAEEKASVETAAIEIGDSVKKHNQKRKSKKEIKKLSRNLPQDQPGKVKLGYFSEHRKMANTGHEIDGFEQNGPFFKYITRPMNDRADWEANRKEEATVTLGELFNAYKATEFAYLTSETLDNMLPNQRLYARKHIPNIPDLEGGMGVDISKMERIMVALNWGNADNRNRVRDGFGWKDEHVDIVLEGLDARDWKFVQGVWDFIDSYWDEIEAKEKRITGVAPEKVEALPVMTPFGQLRGGYFPITFDKDLSQEAGAQQEAELYDLARKGAIGRATTKRGHTKARMDAAGQKPIRLDFGVIFEHVEQVVHDLAWHEFLVNTNKLINHKSDLGPNFSLPAVIQKYMGGERLGVIKNTLRDIAVGETQGVQWHEKAFNYLRTGVSISAMGWNLGTALLQPFGITQGIAKVGPLWVMKGLLRYGRGAVGMESAVKEMYADSSFMRLRAKTLNREVSEIRNKVLKQGFWSQGQRQLFKKIGLPIESMSETYFYVMAKAQLMADTPVWFGAKEKALASGLDYETAIALADQAVIDSQGSGHIKDLAQVQRGSPIKKLFTNFMSYFQVTYNLTLDSLKKAKVTGPVSLATQVVRDPFAVGRLGVDLLMLYTIPIVLTWYAREAFLKGECDFGTDMACVGGKLAKEHWSYLVGGLYGVRELSSLGQGFFGYQGPAGTRFFSDAARLSQQLQKEDIDVKKTIRALNRTGGILFHYPAGQIDKTLTGFMDLQAGKTDIPTAPLFGYSKE